MGPPQSPPFLSQASRPRWLQGRTCDRKIRKNGLQFCGHTLLKPFKEPGKGQQPKQSQSRTHQWVMITLTEGNFETRPVSAHTSGDWPVTGAVFPDRDLGSSLLISKSKHSLQCKSNSLYLLSRSVRATFDLTRWEYLFILFTKVPHLSSLWKISQLQIFPWQKRIQNLLPGAGEMAQHIALTKDSSFQLPAPVVGSSQLPGLSAPEDLMPSFGLLWNWSHMRNP